MRGRKKSWRQFQEKKTKKQKLDCMRIRKICGMLLVMETLILWKQDRIPGIFVERYQQAGLEQLQQADGAILEQILGIRLRIEEGMIEFFCVTEEKR